MKRTWGPSAVLRACAPLAIRALAAMRGGMPVAVRLALTDLVRYQARPGAALAAISLALGISVAIVAGSAAAEYTAKQAAGLGNLSDSQLLIRIGQPDPVIPERTPAQVASLQAQTDAIAAALGTPAVTPLDMAVVASCTDPGRDGGPTGHSAVEIGIPRADGQSSASYPLYVATPELLRLYDLGSTAIAADTDMLSVRSGQLQLLNIREQASLGTLRTGATTAGVLLALGVLAMTVGLIRGEGAGDLRTLTATGAPKRVRRTLTATTAGALAFLGVILGLAGAYIALASTLHRNLGALTGVPVAHLAAITAGLPLLATVAGWLLAGRQPQSFARRGLD